MPRECKLGDQCSVIVVFPLASDDDGQLSAGNHHNNEKEAGLRN